MDLLTWPALVLRPGADDEKALGARHARRPCGLRQGRRSSASGFPACHPKLDSVSKGDDHGWGGNKGQEDDGDLHGGIGPFTIRVAVAVAAVTGAAIPNFTYE